MKQYRMYGGYKAPNSILKRLTVISLGLVAFSRMYGTYTLGVERLAETKTLERLPLTDRIGIITNQTGVDRNNVSTIELFIKAGYTVTALFAPEHGFRGTITAGVNVLDDFHHEYGIPIVSLYEHGRKHVPHQLLEKVDRLVFDIQDVGMRHYTYIATLLQALELALHIKKPLIVLDRPNLLGPCMEGPVAQPVEGSFLSSVPVPLRHGLTVGEIARYLNNYVLSSPAELYVIPLDGYRRDGVLSPYGFVAPSPNISSLDSCKGYSFLGLMGEIRPFDVGIGTDKAFRRFGLPVAQLSKQNWMSVARICNRYGINATYSLYDRRGTKYQGLTIAIPSIGTTRSFSLLIELLDFFKKNKVAMQFSSSFDRAVGSSCLADYYSQRCSYQDLVNTINSDLRIFYAKVKPLLLYEPYPRPCFLSVEKK